jgi:hypothetical protein
MGRVYPKGPVRKQVKEYPERGIVWERDHQDKYTRFNNPEIRSENPANSVDSFGPRKQRAVYGTPERSNARGLRHAGHSWPSVYKHTKIPIRTLKGWMTPPSISKRDKRQGRTGQPLPRSHNIGDRRLRSRFLRGRPHIVTKYHENQMIALLQGSWNHRRMTWKKLGKAVGCKAAEYTIRDHMNARNYRQCRACGAGYLETYNTDARLKWGKKMQKRFPLQLQYKNVLYHDEVHFCEYSHKQEFVIRAPGERYHADCKQNIFKRASNSLHGAALIGFGYKSEFHFIQQTGSKKIQARIQEMQEAGQKVNEKPRLGYTQLDFVRDLEEWIIPCYREFERIRRAYTGKPDTIVWLELDGDGSHGMKSESNPVRECLERHGVSYFANAPRSPGMVPIESCWGIQKEYIKKWKPKGQEALQEGVIQAWGEVQQGSINKMVLSMKRRVDQLVDRKGGHTEWD